MTGLYQLRMCFILSFKILPLNSSLPDSRPRIHYFSMPQFYHLYYGLKCLAQIKGFGALSSQGLCFLHEPLCPESHTSPYLRGHFQK